jgi:zinc protease
MEKGCPTVQSTNQPIIIMNKFILSLCLSAMASFGFAQSKYETAPNDPLNAKIATLSNGMKVYMSVNKDAPRIQTMIATRAGSKNDPSDATGLAHYLEHMLFKGNSHFGTRDWAKEKVELKVISDLYEKRRSVKDEAERKRIYEKIDSVSQLAAGYAIANEYDKMMASIGAEGTNAFTSLEQTVYIEDVPSNELEKWAKVEADRFQELTLRLFHTELEAVYEEYNIGQGYDGQRVFEVLFKNLFPTHTYGTQTTIGTGEHLKNPSMEKIHAYFNKYYVPNNMAIILSGDLDPDKVVPMLEKYFGVWKRKDVPKWNVVPQAKFAKAVEKEVFGNEAPSLTMGYRLGGSGSDDAIKLELLKAVLNNGQAGLFDLDLLQQQKVLSLSAFPWTNHDYSIFWIDGKPREGQTPEQVRDLVLAELKKVADGKFDEWLLAAAVKYLKLQDIKTFESNRGRASAMLDAYITEQSWDKYSNKFARMEKVTKKDLMAFVAKNLNATNYVAVFKRQGEVKDVAKVEKPKITPVPLDKVNKSVFKTEFDAMQSSAMEPKFLDFKNDLQSTKLKSGVTFDYVKNPENPTFEVYYTLDMGKKNDQTLPIAVKLLPYLGSNKYSAKQLQQEFFKLGVSINVFSSDDRTYVSMSGLEESLDKGVALFEHLLANAKPDEKALAGVVADILKERDDNTKDKDALRRALSDYGIWGKKSSRTDILLAADLKKIKCADLVAKIKDLSNFQHKVFYYGTRTPEEANAIISKHHTAKGDKPAPAPAVYQEQATDEMQVFLVNFPDMPQAEVGFLARDDKFDPKVAAEAALYNEYFGGDMSSVIFQEIRESRALAYSTWATYSTPPLPERSHYMRGYVGTQADKLKDAANGVMDLIKNMPVEPARIEASRAAMLKRIRNERITKADIYWSITQGKRMGYDHDPRQDTYETAKKMTVEELKAFQEAHIKNKKFSIMVVGDKTKLDLEYLKTLGKVTELTVQDVMGYDTNHP